MTHIVEIREMSDEVIEERLEDAREELFNLRFQKASARLEDTSRLRTVKRERARLQEVLHKRKLAREAAARQSEIASALAGKQWDAVTRYYYEDSAWIVDFFDENGRDIASAVVNLNQAKPQGKKARKAKRERSLVTNFEIQG